MQIAATILTLALISIAFGLCGYLFLTLKKDLQRGDSRRRGDVSALRAELAMLRAEVDELKAGVDSLPPFAPAAVPLSINLNKRTQALKMMRLGERPEQIATSLRLPRAEIDLLAKVQKLLAGATS